MPRLILKKIALILTILVFTQSTIDAAHLIGGEITYECLGNDSYRFTMTLYRDCAGGGAEFDGAPGSVAPATITFFRGTTNVGTLDLENPIINPIDPDVANSCLIVPPIICVEQGVYIFDRTLQLSNQSYHITYQRCCRNNSISNIVEPATSGATYTVELTPEAQSFCNNSPVFNEFPPIFIPTNDSISLDLSATDIDNDDLRYFFCAPLLGGGTSGIDPNSPPGAASSITGVAPDPDAPPPYNDVEFVSPIYSPIEPIPSLTIDSLTGEITGLASTIGQFLIGVCVEEYKNGELLSTIRRDIQLNVGDCSTPIKEVGSGNDKLSIYPNPSRDYFYLDTSSELPHRIEIFNLNGTRIMTHKVKDANQRISISDLLNGAYIVNAKYENGFSQFAKFVKY